VTLVVECFHGAAVARVTNRFTALGLNLAFAGPHGCHQNSFWLYGILARQPFQPLAASSFALLGNFTLNDMNYADDGYSNKTGAAS
jgi:hypothetical protein